MSRRQWAFYYADFWGKMLWIISPATYRHKETQKVNMKYKGTVRVKEREEKYTRLSFLDTDLG